MLNKRYMTMVMLGTSALLMISAVWAKDLRPIGPGTAQDAVLAADAAPRMQAVMSVARAGDVATYSITVKNIGDVDVKDIFIAGAIAQGTTFVEAGANPAKGWFRGIEGGNAVFLSDGVTARGWGGPFSYKVKLSGDVADQVWAWVHWRSPSDGATLSAPIRVLPSVTVANLVSGPAGNLPQEPLFFEVFEALFVPQVAQPPAATANARVFYQLEGVSSLTQDGLTMSYAPGSYAFIKGGGGLRANANTGDVPARRLVFTYATATQRDRPFSFRDERRFVSEELKGLKNVPYNLLLSLVEAQPGGSTPTHFHSGPTVVYVLEGTTVHNLETGSKVYGPGSFFVEQAGELTSHTNPGPGVNRALSVRLAPEGEPATTFTTAARSHPWTVR